MKNNSKNRKLRFIRTKNRLRKGLILHVDFKYSKEMLCNQPTEEVGKIIESDVKECLLQLKRQWHLVFKFLTVQIGYHGDDIAKDLMTAKMSFKAAN